LLDPATIRETPDAVRKAVRLKGDEADVDGWIALDAERRELIQRADELRALRNRVSEEIAGKKKEKQDASREIAEMRKVGEQIQAMDERLRAVDEELQEISIRIPNVPHPSVPEGDASANEIVRTWGEPRAFPFAAKVHYEIGESLGILDFQRASKVASAGFAVYWSAGALLQRALIRFMIDLHTAEHGYREVYVPFLVNADSMFGTGQLPKLASDMYLAEKDGYYLIPTAEVPVTNLFAKEVLNASGRLDAYRVGPRLIKVDLDSVDALFRPVGGGVADV